jgi:ABC-type lipoprotein release transport system permease subunit
LVALLGTGIGLAVGLLMTTYVNELVDFLASLSGEHLLDGSYFVTVPTRIVIADLLIIGSISSILAVLAAWLPARRASQLNPAQFLH